MEATTSTDHPPQPRVLAADRPSGMRVGGASVRRLLVLLVLSVALPLMALSAVSVWESYASQRGRQEAALVGRAQAAAEAVDREFSSALAALKVMAASAALARGDLAAFGVEMRRTSAALDGALLNLTGPDGMVRDSTLWPAGAPKTGLRAGGFLLGALERNQVEISDIVAGTVTGKPVVGIAFPVADPDTGRPAWMLSLYLPAASFARALDSLHLPPGWLASVLDRTGHWAARSRRQDAYLGRTVPEDLLARFQEDSGIIGDGHRAADGTLSLTAFAHAPQSRYVAALGIPESEFTGPLRATLLRTAAVAAALTLCGFGAAVLLSRRIVGALRKVADAAPGIPLVTGLTEVDELARGIASAEQARFEAERELRALNGQLEARVAAEVAAREAAQARAAQSERLQALGQLAGGIAHDFNNVLQAVHGSAMLIERRADDAERVRRLARMSLDAAERGGAITRRLLAFSRRGDLRAEPLDAAAVLTGLQEILVHTLGSGVEVRLACADGLPALLADKGQLETVLVNLATNARDAMSGTGTLTLTAESLDWAPVGLGKRPGIRISVLDGGTGMDAATLARASEPFFTTKPLGKGTGLGLAMARGFAEQSGGGLEIESEPGVGTAVRLWLPAALPGVTALKTAALELPQAAGRLLLVDDDEAVRQTLAGQLELLGYTVAVAGGAVAALEMLDGGAAVDLLVSDLSMPGMDGMTLIRGAHARRPGLPAILLTGFATEAADVALEGAMGGPFALLRKPVGIAELANRVAVMLAPDAPAPAQGMLAQAIPAACMTD